MADYLELLITDLQIFIISRLISVLDYKDINNLWDGYPNFLKYFENSYTYKYSLIEDSIYGGVVFASFMKNYKGNHINKYRIYRQYTLIKKNIPYVLKIIRDDTKVDKSGKYKKNGIYSTLPSGILFDIDFLNLKGINFDEINANHIKYIENYLHDPYYDSREEGLIQIYINYDNINSYSLFLQYRYERDLIEETIVKIDLNQSVELIINLMYRGYNFGSQEGDLFNL